jgi:hypothetical protein
MSDLYIRVADYIYDTPVPYAVVNNIRVNSQGVVRLREAGQIGSTIPLRVHAPGYNMFFTKDATIPVYGMLQVRLTKVGVKPEEVPARPAPAAPARSTSSGARAHSAPAPVPAAPARSTSSGARARPRPTSSRPAPKPEETDPKFEISDLGLWLAVFAVILILYKSGVISDLFNAIFH